MEGSEKPRKGCPPGDRDLPLRGAKMDGMGNRGSGSESVIGTILKGMLLLPVGLWFFKALLWGVVVVVVILVALILREWIKIRSTSENRSSVETYWPETKPTVIPGTNLNRQASTTVTKAEIRSEVAKKND